MIKEKREQILKLYQWLYKKIRKQNPDAEPPLRLELLTTYQLAQHGKALATSHRLSIRPGKEKLLPRLTENGRLVDDVRSMLVKTVSENRRITPAGEWLLDNFYLIEEQIHIARKHLPKGYSRKLPQLQGGLHDSLSGIPRVYDIAQEVIAHYDGRLDSENLSRFVASYQTVIDLTLGELWAIPIMLRLALIENIRRIAARIEADTVHQSIAALWADRMTEVSQQDPKSLILVIADMARSDPPMASSFVAEFVRRLGGQGPGLALPLTWMEQWLSESGLTIQQLVQQEGQHQAADQVTIGNSIQSLRFLVSMDWREFVETMSSVERILQQDPDGVYGKMDFFTRDRYRHIVERIAKKSRFSETAVATEVLKCATAEAEKNPDKREAHVGYYLIDQGLEHLERITRARLSFVEHAQKMGTRFPLFFYAGSIGILTVLFTGSLLMVTGALTCSIGQVLLLSLLTALGTSQAAIALVNWFVTMLTVPHFLPRMDFAKGIPAEFRTLIIVPGLLTSVQALESLIESLEVRYLANRYDNLYFGLLTDFQDAQTETLPEDRELLKLAQTKIRDLNLKYRGSSKGVFFLFHRPRQWNPHEQIWMGYERKRGKLAALNAFLRNPSQNQFSLIVGETAPLSHVAYVITLDTDTQLPREAAWKLVAAMAHPLNHPEFDDEKNIVIRGYGILQPRVGTSFSAANRSRYARLWGSEPGIDPYTCAVSDVYQDLFHEGSFIGKGIYDVKAFERALNNRFPENRILSHDLIEGCYARSGLLSDVQLIEAYPLHYGEDMRRKQRWIRGDWQIVRWLFSFIPGPDGGSQKNPLSVLSQWKIFDNLRRSLVAPALVLLLLISWTAFPFSCGSSLPWTLAVLGIILVPLVVTSITNLFKKSRDMLLFQHLAEIKNSLIRGIAQAGFTIATLPQEAYFHLDAILRTLWRMVITHKRLLEWNPSDHAKNERNIFYAAPIVAAMVLLGNAWSGLPLPFGVGPVIGAWILSPAVAWWISRPRVPRPVRLREDQIRFLRRISRKTWAFFETFVGPEDNWLPPDNYQEYRIATIAHRTSPTNIGLTLLANLAAHDFGYLSIGGFIDRTNNALATMARLERYRGHFYNWYDTKTLQPLHPHYISTVDSGNLASTLLTLRRGLLAFPDIPILGPQTFQGLLDTLLVLAEIEKRVPSLIRQIRKELETQCSEPLATVMEGVRSLDSLIKRSQELVQKIHELRHQSESKAVWWAEAFLRQCKDLQGDMALFVSGTGFDKNTIQTLRALAHLGNPEAIQRITILARCAEQCELFANAEYEFLYDNSSHLLSIGYNASERRRDASYYDLLASEARISCFMAIAQGCLSQESWFSLGRLLTNVGGDPVLLSWSGSMFEYLMPILVMPRYPDTLLDQSYYAAVARQIDYGKQRGVPWGISESCYNLVDAHLNYQYRGFGVPGLGLKRGLSEDLVISPYASALALTIEPEQACKNLERLAEEGIEGPYGFYEAVDYTPSRQRRGQAKTIVRSFMTHHMGMTFLAMTHMLHNQPMQKRFESDPAVQATLLLLQERIPRATALYSYIDETSGEQIAPGREEAAVRFFTTPDTPHPEVHLLSNGKYHVMITNAGGGYSRWHDTAVTRWREDGTSDNGGLFCYIRDVSTGEFWSVAHQPTLKPADVYESIFSGGKAEFRRRDGDIETYTEIAVSPEDDIELRRITLTNRSSKRKEIEITSYAEVVLAPAIADALHQAFNKLFVQTEILPEENALVCTRRPRSAGERVPWMFHLMTADDADIRSPSYETDRMRFIGRENTLVHPQAMNDFKPLSNTQGSVLDPIAAIRFRIVLDPEKPTIINLVTGVAETRDVCLDLIQKYQDRRLAWRVFDLAWTHNQVILHQLNASEPDAQLYGRLAGSILYANAGLRAEPGILIKNQRGQSGLWGYSISGDLPIVLLQISESANIDLARQLVQAHSFWRQKGLAVDLVIWNEDHAGYRQQLQDQIMGLIAGRMETISRDHPGNIFVRSSDQISNEDRILFQSVARIIITDTRGTLQDQLNRRVIQEPPVPSLIPTKSLRIEPRSSSVGPRQDLAFFNGIGGFTPDGREYIITTSRDQKTPLPWVNILANPVFGTVISECGFAYTWGENAHEFRLTPWQNDPVTDASGEACYLRDEETGYVWSPLPQPARGIGPYVTRHGFGYSVFEHDEDGIHSEVQIFVALDAAIKFTKLTIRNNSGRLRRLSATGYVEWVLGDLRPKYAPHIITKIDPGSGALFARNPYHPIFASRVAFFDVDDTIRTITCDRMEFIGRNNTIRNPAALFREELSNRVGPGLDPCSAIQIPFVLENGQEREIIFRLGFGQNEQNAGDLVRRFRGPDAARIALEGVWNYWARTLGAVQVETPDPSVSIAANGWLLYQSLACRVWARSGYYQSGGAYGFRDQLQDVMALIHTEPGMLRSHLLVCASRQFLEGDVQHWWHPPSGQGVRTRCSDDYLWLPLAVCRYVLWTKDTGVLAEMIPFLEGRPLNPDEESWYDHPIRSEQAASLYDHCVLAIKRGLSVGEHGLPLMGSGDWNDGMNNVGIDGKGESVWLGFFLYSILIQFSKIARLHQDAVFADICEEKAEELRQNLEQHGWDGEWYRRAYFDDGMPLGSESNPECKIDSISQSWSVLSGAASPERAAQALEAVNARLVRRNDKLIQLLNPPFDTSDINPGYIKGYVPGVRENGGQYTHAAIWAVMAFAQSGDPVRAWELFNLINPLNHARTREEMETYKVEPYVVAADVYAASAHVGRGGWTWYTGSAGWMYRLIIESLLGLRVEGEKLYFEPCLPPDWESYKIHYRYRETTYHISIVQLHSEVQKMTMIQDGVVRTEQYIILVDDHQEHFVEIKIETK